MPIIKVKENGIWKNVSSNSDVLPYKAGEGISLSETTFSNAGVRSVTQDSANKSKLIINTNGVPEVITIPNSWYDNTRYSSGIVAAGNGHSNKVWKTNIDGVPAWGIIDDATVSSSGLMSSSDKTKLNTVEEGAEVNQNAFSGFTVGNTSINANSKSAKLELIAGNNITLTSNSDNRSITITSANTTYGEASASSSGLLSSSLYSKLIGIEEGAQANENAFGKFIIGSNTISATGFTDSLTFVAGNGITLTPNTSNKSITITSITYDDATVSSSGLMSKEDKIKLNGVEVNANNYILPVATSSALGGIKSGTDITIDASGNVSVNDNSHSHTIANITNLQSSLNAKLETSLKGATNGLAELDSSGKVPTSQLPSYVSDVAEGTISSGDFVLKDGTTATMQDNIIYVDTSTNKTYRWSGSALVEISASLALGETSSTAYRGDRGLAAYKHASNNGATDYASGFYKFGYNSQGHITSRTVVVQSDLTDLLSTYYLKTSGGTMTGTLILTENIHFGTSVPSSGTKGQIFFVKA